MKRVISLFIDNMQDIAILVIKFLNTIYCVYFMWLIGEYDEYLNLLCNGLFHAQFNVWTKGWFFKSIIVSLKNIHAWLGYCTMLMTFSI
jgi:hypothetical protein